MKTYSHSVMSFWLLCRLKTSVWSLQLLFLSVIIEYRSVLRWQFRSSASLSACWLLTLFADLIMSRTLFNVFYIRSALDSSNWIKICLDSSSRILQPCCIISSWLFCWWLWTSLCPVYQVCCKIIFCSFGMFEFFPRSTLFCFSFGYCWLSYLVIYSDCALSIWASPAKFK